VTITVPVPLVSVSVEKEWNDADNQDGIRPPNVSVQLKADGTNLGEPVSLTAAGNWRHTWSGLQKYNEAREEIVYTVVETDVPAGYSLSQSVNDAGDHILTNSHTPEETSVSVRKAWNDANNQDGIRPSSVSVQLKAGSTNVGDPVVLNAGNSWSHTWENLPKYAGTTTPIVYTVVETPVPSGYTSATAPMRPATWSPTPTCRKRPAFRCARSGMTPTTRTANARPG
jgi:hypothetical protein